MQTGITVIKELLEEWENGLMGDLEARHSWREMTGKFYYEIDEGIRVVRDLRACIKYLEEKETNKNKT